MDENWHWRSVLGERVMRQGRHYWEVEIVSTTVYSYIMVGVARASYVVSTPPRARRHCTARGKAAQIGGAWENRRAGRRGRGLRSGKRHRRPRAPRVNR